MGMQISDIFDFDLDAFDANKASVTSAISTYRTKIAEDCVPLLPDANADEESAIIALAVKYYAGLIFHYVHERAVSGFFSAPVVFADDNNLYAEMALGKMRKTVQEVVDANGLVIYVGDGISSVDARYEIACDEVHEESTRHDEIIERVIGGVVDMLCERGFDVMSNRLSSGRTYLLSIRWGGDLGDYSHLIELPEHVEAIKCGIPAKDLFLDQISRYQEVTNR